MNANVIPSQNKRAVTTLALTKIDAKINACFQYILVYN